MDDSLTELRQMAMRHAPAFAVKATTAVQNLGFWASRSPTPPTPFIYEPMLDFTLQGSALRGVGSEFSVDQTAADGAHVNATEHVHVTLDEGTVARTAILVLVVIHALPGRTLIGGIVNPHRVGGSARNAPDEDGLVGRPVGGFADTHRLCRTHRRQGVQVPPPSSDNAKPLVLCALSRGAQMWPLRPGTVRMMPVLAAPCTEPTAANEPPLSVDLRSLPCWFNT